MWLYYNITECLIFGLFSNGGLQEALQTLNTRFTPSSLTEASYMLHAISDNLFILRSNHFNAGISNLKFKSHKFIKHDFLNCRTYKAEEKDIALLFITLCYYSFWSTSMKGPQENVFISINFTANNNNNNNKLKGCSNQITVKNDTNFDNEWSIGHQDKFIPYSTKCRLQKGSQCWYGICCNFETCQYHSNNQICRSSSHDVCDLTEYCNGFSPNCPRDEFFPDNSPCLKVGLCYKKKCVSPEILCKKIHPMLLVQSKKCSLSKPGQDKCKSLTCELPNKLPIRLFKQIEGGFSAWKNCLKINHSFDGLSCGRNGHCQSGKCKENRNQRCYCINTDEICTNLGICKRPESIADHSQMNFMVYCMGNLMMFSITCLLILTYKIFLEHLRKMSLNTPTGTHLYEKKTSSDGKKTNQPTTKVTVFKDSGDERFHTLAVMQCSPHGDENDFGTHGIHLKPESNHSLDRKEENYPIDERGKLSIAHQKKRMKFSPKCSPDQENNNIISTANMEKSLKDAKSVNIKTENNQKSAMRNLLSDVVSEESRDQTPMPGKVEYLNYPRINKKVADRCHHNYSYLERKYAMPRCSTDSACCDYSREQTNESNLRRRPNKIAKEKTKVDLASKESIAHFVDDNHLMDGIDDVENVVYVVIPNKKRY